MEGVGIESRAAKALRTYEGRLRRAQLEHDEARKVFDQTAIDLQRAEEIFEAAKDVYQAGDADRSRDLGLDTIRPVTRAWIDKLRTYPQAGSAELKEAASSVGWDASPAGIRQKTKRLTEKGVLTRLGDGVYRVSDRASDALRDSPELSGNESADGDFEGSKALVPEAASANCDISTVDSDMANVVTSSIRDSQGDDRSGARSRFEDEYDDDLPF